MSDMFNVLFLGASRINFGSGEGSWNHSLRLEKLLRARLNAVAVLDINTAHAESILAAKRASGVKGYDRTKVFNTLQEAKTGLGQGDSPILVINGLPPSLRGSTKSGSDIDVQVSKLFPEAVQLIEKPLSGSPVEEVEQAAEELKKGGIVSVGYMLRYLSAVTEMKRIIKENNLTIMCTQATYLMAYKWAGENAVGMDYWDVNREFGPIVNQGTHLVDLSRFFCPDPDFDTLRVHTVEHSDKPGKLSKLVLPAEAELPRGRRIPRITHAVWKYGCGATGSLLHGICLHEGDYDCELLVIADGWKFRLVDPYGTAPLLYTRKPGTTAETRIEYKDDDPFFNEFNDLIDVIDGKKSALAIRSPYSDALNSYKFTWAIRRAGEAEARTLLSNYRAARCVGNLHITVHVSNWLATLKKKSPEFGQSTRSTAKDWLTQLTTGLRETMLYYPSGHHRFIGWRGGYGEFAGCPWTLKDNVVVR